MALFYIFICIFCGSVQGFFFTCREMKTVKMFMYSKPQVYRNRIPDSALTDLFFLIIIIVSPHNFPPLQ